MTIRHKWMGDENMNIEQAMINGNERALISEMTVAQYSLEEIHEVLRLLHELTKKNLQSRL